MVKSSTTMNDGKRKIDSDYTGKPSAGAPIVMTSKIRAVLYYLISISYWDAKNKERHYYVHKKDFVQKKAADFLHINRKTVSEALKFLLEKGIIRQDDKYYFIPHPSSYTYISQEVMKYLLCFYESGAEMIRICAIINDYIGANGDRGLSISDITEMRGKACNDARALGSTKFMISFLIQNNFLECYLDTAYNNCNPYSIYRFTKTNLTNLPISCNLEGGYAPRAVVEEYKQKYAQL